MKRSDLAGYASYGYCASHSRYFWGFRLHLLAGSDGMPIDWCLASPKIGEREVATAMLDADPPRPGQTILADKGYAGAAFEHHLATLGVDLIRPDRRDENPRFGPLGGARQWIESIFDTTKGQLSLEQHGGRTIGGVFTRVAQRLLALAAAIWFNWRIDAPTKRSLIAYDH